MKRQMFRTWMNAWIPFWEGVVIVIFFGLWWACVFFAAFSLVAIGVAIGRRAKR